MRQEIETAPRNGTTVILEDDASGTYDVAHWSAEAGRWVGENGEPSNITPTHWHQRPRDQYLLQGDERQPRRFSALPIVAVGVLLMGLMGLYFEVFDSEAVVSKQDSHKTTLTFRQPAEADHSRVKAGTQVKQAVEAPPQEARQSVTTGQSTESLTNEPAENRSAIDGLDRQLQAEVANSAQSFEQDQQRTTVLAREATAARNEPAASAEQHRQALEEERARSAALASELATAQREIEAQAAQLRKASDETAQHKQAEAAKSARSLEEEREKAAALALEAAARKELAASTEQHHQALGEERARSAALASELATAHREIEVQVEQLRQAYKETEQLKRATESATTELRQHLQHKRDGNEAMARDLESALRTVGARVTPGPATGNPTSRAAQTVGVAAGVQPAAAGAKGGPEATRLIARASVLLGQGDIGAARTVLERASERGSAKASFMLAETYDPAILTAWGTYGTRGEVTKAHELYAKAHAGGIPEAKNRLNALPR